MSTLTWTRIPLFSYDTADDLFAGLPYSCRLIGVEMGGDALPQFEHPSRAVYLLGAEDGGLPSFVARRCHGLVSIPSVRDASYNVAQAGTIIMYDRLMKCAPFRESDAPNRESI